MLLNQQKKNQLKKKQLTIEWDRDHMVKSNRWSLHQPKSIDLQEAPTMKPQETNLSRAPHKLLLREFPIILRKMNQINLKDKMLNSLRRQTYVVQQVRAKFLVQFQEKETRHLVGYLKLVTLFQHLILSSVQSSLMKIGKNPREWLNQ